MADGVTNFLMMIVGNIVECYEQKIANELANVTCVHRLSGNDLGDAKDLRVRDLFDLLRGHKERVDKSVKDLRLNELVDTHGC